MRLGRTVSELLETVSSEEITEWMAFDTLEPIGDWRSDLAAGVVASTFANAHRKKDSPPFKALDFMPLAERAMDVEEARRHAEEELSRQVRSALLNASGKPFEKG